MPFHLTSDQELIRKTVRELAEEFRGKPAEHIDRERRFPADAVRKLAGLGLTAMLVPAEKGGAGTDTVSFVLAIEEVARVSGTLALVLNNLNAFGTFALTSKAGAARDDVLSQALPPLVTGERTIAWAHTEPNAGSDAGAIQTRAVKTGAGWKLSGLKSFVVGAPEAAHFLVTARSVSEGADVPAGTSSARTASGQSLFLVPADAAGLKVAPAERSMTMRGSDMAQVFLKDVEVPSSHLVGDEGAAPAIAQACTEVAALGAAAIANGIMQASIEDSIAYAGDREQFRMPIKRFQAIQFLVADMETQLRAARLLTYSAADRRDRGEEFATDAAAAKLYAGEVAKFVTQKGIRIHGGTGFMRDLPIERYNRDARSMSIYAGTSEAERAALAAKALGL